HQPALADRGAGGLGWSGFGLGLGPLAKGRPAAAAFAAVARVHRLAVGAGHRLQRALREGPNHLAGFALGALGQVSLALAALACPRRVARAAIAAMDVG